MNRPIKVGFDLDGVLLYNPARVFRPITLKIKSILGVRRSEKTSFYIPNSNIEKLIWHIVHWSSLFIASGYKNIGHLGNNNKMHSYIVTSRFDCLKNDFQSWLKKMNAKSVFKATYHNKFNLQPHIFKTKMINNLKLDYFIEDNWDIVKYLNENTKAKILWITNILDKSIPYDLKFNSLKDALKFLQNQSSKS